MNDWQLLRRYVEDGSETAFGQLVERHKKLVYWTCRREVSDPQLAEDAAQAVFIVMVRKASTIRKDASLAGWLFSVARNVARNAQISDARRRKNEERAALRMQREVDPNAVWEQVEPWLNDALSALPGADRSAVLLRYAEGYSFQEIASQLGTTEEAARKRVSRSLDRLRLNLSKKGVTVAASVLGAVLLERSANAIPETFTAVSGHAILAAASSGHARTALLTKGVHIAVAATKKKLIVTAVTAAILALGVTAGVMRARVPVYTIKGGSHFSDPTISFGESAAEAAARAAINARYREQVEKILSDDTEGLEAMMAESWIGTVAAEVGPQPSAMTKAQWREARTREDHKLLARTTFDVNIQSIQIDGNRAKVRIIWDAHFNLGKRRQIDDIHTDEDEWVRQGGVWLWSRNHIATDRELLNGKPKP